jgi:integrase
VLEEIDLVGPISGVIGHRDWLMILFGFVGAYRRSELAFLTVGDVTRHSEDGLHVMLRRSKTDQAGVGLLKALPHAGNFITCAPCAFTKWIRLLAVVPAEASSMAALLQTSRKNKHVCHEALPELFLLDPGSPLIRPVMKGGHIADRHISGNVVNDAVKRRMENAGFDSKKFGAHSLRAGFVTQAFRDGATHHEVMRQTGHKTTSSVEHYARELNPLMANAVGKMQL